jgi:hypothetical protein
MKGFPWRWHQHDNGRVELVDVDGMSLPRTREFIDFIVNACNSHYELLDALGVAEDFIKTVYDPEDATPADAISKIRNAINKAKGTL